MSKFPIRRRIRRAGIGGHSRDSRAFTLLEVILALVILGGALAVLGEVMQLANSGAVGSRAETQAQLLASSVMDEILAGVRDDSPTTRQPLDLPETPRWLYSVRTETSDVAGVYPLEVIVEQDLEPQFNPVKFRLLRWAPTVPETSENFEESSAGGQQGSGQGQSSGSGSGDSGSGSSGGSQ